MNFDYTWDEIEGTFVKKTFWVLSFVATTKPTWSFYRLYS
jgi:hypothetical protein